MIKNITIITYYVGSNVMINDFFLFSFMFIVNIIASFYVHKISASNTIRKFCFEQRSIIIILFGNRIFF